MDGGGRVESGTETDGLSGNESQSLHNGVIYYVAD